VLPGLKSGRALVKKEEEEEEVSAWLYMIPAVDHVLCNRRAIGAYGNNGSCLSANIPGEHYVKMDQ
jgi:hypothetical protein